MRNRVPQPDLDRGKKETVDADNPNSRDSMASRLNIMSAISTGQSCLLWT